jgi:hypothetical protein
MTYEEELPEMGLKLEVTLVDWKYRVNVFANAGGGMWQHVPGGADMLPPDIVQAAKLKLWEMLRP